MSHALHYDNIHLIELTGDEMTVWRLECVTSWLELSKYKHTQDIGYNMWKQDVIHKTGSR